MLMLYPHEYLLHNNKITMDNQSSTRYTHVNNTICFFKKFVVYEINIVVLQENL